MWKTKNNFTKQLIMSYSVPEINSFWALIMEQMFGYSYTDSILKSNEILSPEAVVRIDLMITRLLRREPIQYILGSAHFFDFVLKVSSFVLIPRVETEELVHHIIDENKNFSGKILDIGTGSGCIAIALKRAFPQSDVHAIDVSEKALLVAEGNAHDNNAQIFFKKMNILDFENEEEQPRFDIIVSNPPYVRNKERETMDANVVNYEPSLALFVSDHDPLVFYRKIAEYAVLYLNEGGKLYFEINEGFGPEIVELLLLKGFQNIKLSMDFYEKDRFVECALFRS